MSGVTFRHDRIAGRIFAAILDRVGDGRCTPFIGEVMFRVASDAIYYPDVMVTCDPIADARRIVDTPCLVVEVTSPSTRTIDRREKLAAYKRASSVRVYLIVEQGARLIERHWREDDGVWRHETITAGTFAVPCPVATLSVDEIYRGIELDADETGSPSLRVREGEPA
jgi:Uma2 family endonuclease